MPIVSERFKSVFFVLILALSLLTTGCATNRTLLINSPARFKEGLKVRTDIKQECDLGYNLPRYVEPFSRRHFRQVALGGDVNPGPDEEVLSLTITDLTTERIKGMQSGPTALTVEGVLTKNGAVIGSFIAFRDANVELITRDRGDCHFLTFCAKAIGKDISRWLGKPGMNSILDKNKRYKGPAKPLSGDAAVEK